MLLIGGNKVDFGIYKTEYFYSTEITILRSRFDMKELTKIPSNGDPSPET